MAQFAKKLAIPFISILKINLGINGAKNI